MKKLDNKGFVLAETLVVTVFLMVIFTMLYRNFYPLIGEYEKRETYNDIDSIYSVYWLKRIIEDPAYQVSDEKKKESFTTKGYMRFECKDVSIDSEKQEMCITLVKSLEVEGCSSKGNDCDIFITNYQIGGNTPDFKTVVKEENKDNVIKKYQELDSTPTAYINKCIQDRCPLCISSPSEVEQTLKDKTKETCQDRAQQKVFNTSFQDYVRNLPDYTTPSLNSAKYRVIAVFHHKKDNNNYYSYATIEVNKGNVPT